MESCLCYSFFFIQKLLIKFNQPYKDLERFWIFYFFYSVDGDISQKAMLIELVFVLLVLFSFIFFIIIFVNSIYFKVFFFNFGDLINIDFMHVNVVNSKC
jgi:hypothetical protein